MIASAHERLEALARLSEAAEGLDGAEEDGILPLSKSLLACADAAAAFGPALPFALLDGLPAAAWDGSETERLCSALAERAVEEAIDALSGGSSLEAAAGAGAAAELRGGISRVGLTKALAALNVAGGCPFGAIATARSCFVGAMVFLSGPDGFLAAMSAAIQAVETVRIVRGESAGRNALSRMGRTVAAAL